MTAPRRIKITPVSGVPEARWPAGPGPGFRSTRPRRPHVADEERRLLRETHAVFEGPARRADADVHLQTPWQAEEPASPAGPSRLFRE